MPKLMWMKFKMTGMSERDQVQSISFTEREDGKVLMVMNSVEHPDYPVTDAIIRIESFRATLMEDKEGGGSKTTTYSTMDMKGWFPMRLINMMIGSMVSKGI